MVFKSLNLLQFLEVVPLEEVSIEEQEIVYVNKGKT